MMRAFESPVPDRSGVIAAGPMSLSSLGDDDGPDDDVFDAAGASDGDDVGEVDDDDLEDEDLDDDDLDDDELDDLDDDDEDDDLVDLDDEYDDFDDEDRHPGPGRGDD